MRRPLRNHRRVQVDGGRLTEGDIGLRGESQPAELRNIRLRDVTGCADPASPAYRHTSCADCARCSGKGRDQAARAAESRPGDVQA